MKTHLRELTLKIEKSHAKFLAAKEEIAKIIVGQTDLIDKLLIALLANGHLLLEGLPGLVKTLAVTTLAKVLQCEFKRVQFTPDLLPADLLGTSIYNPKDSTFSIHKGPIFTQILLADEINRAPAKVQSALLEVMQERQVTISGTTFPMGNPYLVLATQNPIEHEGTYPLPEAQTDRFMMKVKITYPSIEEEKEILHRMGTLHTPPQPKALLSTSDILEARQLIEQIYIDDKIIDYILTLVNATRTPPADQQRLIKYGVSPRASIALKLCGKAHAFLSGRAFVIPHDIKQVGHDILRHRLQRTYEAEAEEISSDDLITRFFAELPPP